MNFQQIFAKFHAKKLNGSENIPKSFRGGGYFFLNTRYVGAGWGFQICDCFEPTTCKQRLNGPATNVPGRLRNSF